MFQPTNQLTSSPFVCIFQVWVTGKMSPSAGPYDFEAPYANWGIGNLAHTSLYSPDGVEKAAHTQRLDYSP
ncbi:hypothetical protein AHF37_12443 [Paragonimus kellicotti]|nr:hypothetical protein AHF37_12443 [Paragonimus kellicotti]